MKFFSAATVFLASLASTAFAGPLDDFGLGTSTTIDYDVNSNEFTITFVGGATSTNNAWDFEYYEFDCTTPIDGPANGFTGGDFGNDSGNTVPIFTFTVDMSVVKTSGTFTENGANSEVKLCVKNIVLTSDSSIEVNFQESQMTLTMDLTANVFTETTVAKRDKNAEIEAEQTYEITTTLCDPNQVTPLRQGDLITVCMEPSSTDVVIASLTDFTWTQRGGTNVAQDAVNPADTAANALSSAPDCATVRPTLGATCQFTSVLKADFYTVTNVVDGGGSATFALNRRRLNAGSNTELEERMLQGLEGDVNVAVPLDNSDTGPGALKTAGGASLGASALASGVALLSAALLA